jgi:membrane-associated protein
MSKLIDIFLHLNKYLNELAGDMGPWLYVLLFVVIFCETGLVVTPFLPGDSLLFAVGALAAHPESPIDVGLCGVLLSVAAILGDAVNYSAGFWVGPRVFSSEKSRLFKKDHLLKTQRFYEKYGGKTIILARFVPIVRTFAPFVAGIGKMRYARFALFNVFGGVIWVVIFLAGGYAFGNNKFVQDNFVWVEIAIVAISLLPIVFEVWKSRSQQRLAASRPEEPAV